MRISRITLLVGALAFLVGAVPVQAQDRLFGAGVGAAIPVGGAGERRDSGPAAMLSVEYPEGRVLSLRLDAEWSLLDARPAPPGEEHLDLYQDLRTYGASLNFVARFPEEQIATYLLIGIGAYRLQAVGQDPSPYGTTGALQAGFGIDANIWERLNPFVEARALVHITDYGSEESSPTVYWPVLIGLRRR